MFPSCAQNQKSSKIAKTAVSRHIGGYLPIYLVIIL